MTLYQQISGNRVKTYLILFLFVVLLSGFFFAVGAYFESPTTYFIFGFVFALVSSVGSYFYSDKIVLYTVSAKPANRREHFDFYTTCENLTMAAGLPMPKLYVIDDPSPNAFATGRDPKHAVVCATTGLLTRLDRSDLEGVIAHELSHIKNYDILVSTIVAVLVGTIAITADFIMRSLWWGGGNRDRNKNPIFLVLFIVALILGPIAATLIQLAVSRRREYLADASGVLITRNPNGLADALEKIARDPTPVVHATTSTAHLFISNPFKKGKKAQSWLTSLFSTHPPIEERVKILRAM